MSSYCKDCSVKFLGKDFQELAGLCEKDEIISVICEGCPKEYYIPSSVQIWVNHLGERQKPK